MKLVEYVVVRSMQPAQRMPDKSDAAIINTVFVRARGGLGVFRFDYASSRDHC
jgi:hypothetical protein